jgi:Ca-activated chloride channel family protein
MKTRLLVLMAILLALPAFAERVAAGSDGTIAGVITDAGTKEPIIGASVILKGTKIGAQTDLDGKFIILRVPPGRYTLVITSVGFGSVEITDVIVKADLTTEVNQTLTVQSSAGKAVTVQGKRDVISKYETSGQIFLSKERIKSQPVQHADDVLGHISGVQTKPVPGIVPDLFQQNQSPLPPFDMFFRDYGTNGWVRTNRDQLSTFAVDVDDASYNLVKQYLIDGNMPPADAVRVEEFINHFDYGYRPPANGKFRIFTETSFSPFDARTVFLKVGIKGREITESARLPLRLTFVIDVSGSMGYDNRLELVKQALRLIVQQMSDDDRIGIIAFGSTAYVVLEPVAGDRKRELAHAIDRLCAGGSTFAEAGLRLGYEMATDQYVSGYTNRIILCSDGVANVGRTGPDDIMREVTRNARTGVTLSTFGFGMGNYNDVLLEKLAQKGNGRYAYVNNWEEARRQFVEQLISNVQVLARDVKIQVAFDPAVVEAYRLLGYENRAVADNKFRDNKTDGGEIGAGHEVTALYELRVNRHARTSQLATVNVRWKETNQRSVGEVSEIATFTPRSNEFTSARPELRLAVVASRFAEMIKGTTFSENTSYDDLQQMAARIARQLPNDQTRELVDLISRARTLADGSEYWRAEGDDDDNNYKR